MLGLVVFNFSADEILNKALENFTKVRTIAGEIDRQIESPAGNAKISGIFYFKTPDKLRLNFSSPDYEEVVINGKTFFDYKPSKKEYTVRSLPDSLEMGNCFLGLKQTEFEFLKRRFSFSLIWHGTVKGYTVFLLEGKGSESGIAKVLIWVDQQRFVPIRLETFSTGKYPTTIYQVDSLSFVGGRYWQPTRYRLFLGIEKGTITVTSRLGRLRIDEEIPDKTFEI